MPPYPVPLPPQPYIVSADVARTFDCIDISRLLDIVQPVLHNEEYLVIRWATVRLCDCVRRVCARPCTYFSCQVQ